MPFEQIETKKREYTDKYVMVDAAQPELARFRDIVGQVKTVNMSGRALVEFMDYHLNIAWYDIDPAFLKIVDKPAPKAAKPEEKKPAKAEAKAAPVAKTPAAKAPAAGAKPGKSSVADILAAARGNKPATGGGEAASAAGKPKPEPTPPAAAPQAAAKPVAMDRSKMSVADMLAAARGGAAGSTAKPQAAPPAAKKQAEAAPVKVEAPAEIVAATSTTAAAAKPAGKVDRSKMSVADMLVYCRQHDAN